jgi:hypothetical protein
MEIWRKMLFNKIRLVVAGCALLTGALLTGIGFAQVPQEWTAWRKLTNAESGKPGGTLSYRWRKIQNGAIGNVPLEVEIRNTGFTPEKKAEHWTLMILYERGIAGTTYLQNVPRRELCYLSCTAEDSPEGAACKWSGSEGAVGTKLLEARVMNAEAAK